MKRVLVGSVLCLILSSSTYSFGAGDETSVPAVSQEQGQVEVRPPVEADHSTAITATLASTGVAGAGSGSSNIPEHAPVHEDHAVTEAPVPTFKELQENKIREGQTALHFQAMNVALFRERDKKPINSILNKIMKIIESDRDGTVKLRIAALHLQELLDIHTKRGFSIGCVQKRDALMKLDEQVKSDLESLDGKPKLDYTEDDITHEIVQLKKDKFDEKIIKLLLDYFSEKTGKISAYGGSIGGAGLIGVELGGYLGKTVTATGRRYPTVGVKAALVVGLGPIFSGGHYSGDTQVEGAHSHYASKRMGLPFEIFLAGHTESTETSPGEQITLKESVIAPIRAGSIGVMKPFKLFPFGRDYKSLRGRLGLIANVEPAAESH